MNKNAPPFKASCLLLLLYNFCKNIQDKYIFIAMLDLIGLLYLFILGKTKLFVTHVFLTCIIFDKHIIYNVLVTYPHFALVCPWIRLKYKYLLRVYLMR